MALLQHRLHIIAALALLMTATLTWCAAYGRWTRAAWSVPVSYSSDALGILALSKSYSSEVGPLFTKYPSSFGAPFRANWNDYPTFEEGVFAWSGLAARLFGVELGSNLSLLSAHLLAASSFFLVAIILRCTIPAAFAGGLLYSSTHFIFVRSLLHLTLSFYWLLPIYLLIAWWCVSENTLFSQRTKLGFSCVVAVLAGVQSPYYSWAFVQCLGAAVVICLIRRSGWSRVAVPLLLGAVVVAMIALVNVDTLAYQWSHGENNQALIRNYGGVEKYALKPIELFLPTPHRLARVQQWVVEAYTNQALFHGETGSPYLGVIGLAGLLALLVVVVCRVASDQPVRVPWTFWAIAWFTCYSMVGGANSLLALSGFVLFRGTNRYAILILTLLLLFVTRRVAALQRRKPVAALSLIVCGTAVGLWDQIPPHLASSIPRIAAKVRSDRELTQRIERALPQRAMLFQLPVMEYPESPPVGKMLSYDHFRPYLYSEALRYSFGNHKGRTRDQWQSDAVQLGADGLINLSECYGFSGILIDRDGYTDGGTALVAALANAGRGEVIASSDDFICLRLQPKPNPMLPPDFISGWYGLEGKLAQNWRWASGNATIALYNNLPKARAVHVTFRLATLTERRVSVRFRGAVVGEHILAPSGSTPQIDLLLTILPGRNDLHFETSTAASLPGNGDVRRLAFQLMNLELSAEPD